DIPLLAAHFLEQAARRLHLPMPRFSESQSRLLKDYGWPGNVRELQNATERALILARNGVLRFDFAGVDFPNNLPIGSPSVERSQSAILTEAELRSRERQNMLAALTQSGWRIHGAGGAAERLELKPTTLISRMKKLGLKKPAQIDPASASNDGRNNHSP